MNPNRFLWRSHISFRVKNQQLLHAQISFRVKNQQLLHIQISFRVKNQQLLHTWITFRVKSQQLLHLQIAFFKFTLGRTSKQWIREQALSLSLNHSQSSAPEVSPETCSFQEKPSCFVETNCDLPIAVRKGRRSCTKHLIAHFLSFQKIDSEYKTFVANLSNETIPRNVEEALKDPKWKEAINKEIKVLRKNNTWGSIKLTQREECY